MNDIEFNCPHCEGSLVVDGEGAGTTVDCPRCSNPIQIPTPQESVKPAPTTRTIKCPFCREEIQEGAIKCKHCQSMLVRVKSTASPDLPDTGEPPQEHANQDTSVARKQVARIMVKTDEDKLIVRLANYELVSGIFWLLLGAIQVCTCWLAIAGGWNIYAGICRIKTKKFIRTRDSSIPARFRPITGLVIIGVINVLLGGIIGIVLIGFDIFIREKIIENSHLFVATDTPPKVIGVTP